MKVIQPVKKQGDVVSSIVTKSITIEIPRDTNSTNTAKWLTSMIKFLQPGDFILAPLAAKHGSYALHFQDTKAFY